MVDCGQTTKCTNRYKKVTVTQRDGPTLAVDNEEIVGTV